MPRTDDRLTTTEIAALDLPAQLARIVADDLPRAIGYVTTAALAAESGPTGIVADRDGVAIAYTLRAAEDALWQMSEEIAFIASRLRPSSRRRGANGKA